MEDIRSYFLIFLFLLCFFTVKSQTIDTIVCNFTVKNTVTKKTEEIYGYITGWVILSPSKEKVDFLPKHYLTKEKQYLPREFVVLKYKPVFEKNLKKM